MNAGLENLSTPSESGMQRQDGKSLISGSADHSIRMWNTAKWEQITVLIEHTCPVCAIAISPNDHIIASASYDYTVRLWNLDDGQPIGSPLEHAGGVNCVSFSVDGKLIATGCFDGSTYTWDVAAIVKEVELDDLVSYPKLAYGSHSESVQSGSTFLGRLFHCNPSNTHDTSPSSPLNWARNLLKLLRRSDESIKLHWYGQALVEVPYAKGEHRNTCVREQWGPVKFALEEYCCGCLTASQTQYQ